MKSSVSYCCDSRRALDVIKLYFSKICLTDQDVLGTEDGIKKVLQIIPDEELRLNCVSKLEKVSGGSTERWKLLRDCVVEARDKVMQPLL